MSARVQKKIGWRSQNISELPATDTTLREWLITQGNVQHLRYALAHADDGVIWGQFDNGAWTWSSGYIPRISPTLQLSTIQQLRLFGANAELFVWREGIALYGRLITDGVGEAICFDEAQLIWGLPDGTPQGNFQRLSEGAQGLLHAPPVALITNLPQLMTRNYIDFDNDNNAVVVASRLIA